MATSEPKNGVSRAGVYLSAAASGAMLLGLVGAVFYVGFSTRANSDAIAGQALVNQALNVEIRALQLRAEAQAVAMNEIETQFCGEDIVRNLMHANDMRTMALLWEKTFAGRMPTDNAFYPSICNRRVK
jgi:hypothetical protein